MVDLEQPGDTPGTSKSSSKKIKLVICISLTTKYPYNIVENTVLKYSYSTCRSSDPVVGFAESVMSATTFAAVITQLFVIVQCFFDSTVLIVFKV